MHLRLCDLLSHRHTAPWIAATVALGLACLAPAAGLAHSTGQYATQAEAVKRAQQLRCAGTHRVKDRWMPCRNEQDLHRALRRS